MNFDWNLNTIKWFQEANKYSEFFKNIAGLIAPRLEGYSTLCDIGCGLGLVDLELSKSIKSITCMKYPLYIPCMKSMGIFEIKGEL